MTDAAARVATARRWFRQLGHEPVTEAGVTIVATPAHPDTWEVNFAQVEPGTNPRALLDALDRRLAHSPWRVVASDALTDPAIEATLALHGHIAEPPVIEFLAHDAPASHHALPKIITLPVDRAEHWRLFDALVDADHREGARTGHYDPAVAAGLLDAMHRRSPPCDYWLIADQDAPIDYGLTVACPGGLGLIEHLFVLRAHRGHGIMSAFIVAAGARLLAGGCDALFIDAYAGEPPARLYASLGFTPVGLTRNWVRRTHV